MEFNRFCCQPRKPERLGEKARNKKKDMIKIIKNETVHEKPKYRLKFLEFLLKYVVSFLPRDLKVLFL